MGDQRPKTSSSGLSRNQTQMNGAKVELSSEGNIQELKRQNQQAQSNNNRNS